MGSGEWGTRDKENNPCPMPNAQCPMPNPFNSIFLECDRHLITSVK
ncbi:MAG: hypothetical protein V7L04_23525 [Nostoc sp.]